uniref:Uncharacterized protein n=2 Tax=Candidatus Kentrum sp. FM TaxID=2126340 RepID=A0A450VT95_9GAMM|nr:MAG: hypothetical protein BECKFM1743B_GA0114221_100563 [Candidatus Kentron sp. FM]
MKVYRGKWFAPGDGLPREMVNILSTHFHFWFFAECEPKCDFSQVPTGGRGDSEPKIPAPGCNCGHGSAGASPSRISLTLPKPYLGIFVLGSDSDKSHFRFAPVAKRFFHTLPGLGYDGGYRGFEYNFWNIGFLKRILGSVDISPRNRPNRLISIGFLQIAFIYNQLKNNNFLSNVNTA